MLTSLPNLLTLSRIAAVPILVALLYIDTPLCRWLALGLFVAAAVTDYFDGWLARQRSEVSAIGRFLDPIADKLLVAAVLLMLVAIDTIRDLSILPALIILCREILVSGLREYLAEIRVPMPVSKMAKWKTMIQMVALGFLIVGETGPAAIPVQEIGVVGLWIAGVMTMVTGYDYLQRGMRHMLGGEMTRNGSGRERAGGG